MAEDEETEKQDAAEPLVPLAPKKTAAAPKTSRRPAKRKQKHTEPTKGELASTETDNKAPRQQVLRPQAPWQQASQQQAPPAVRHARAPSPPAKASGSGSQAHWVKSALDEEEEDE